MVVIDAETLIGGALGGAIVQSIVGPLVMNGSARRDIRATVLRRIGEVERRRWAPGSWDALLESAAALSAEALVAGMPRDLVDVYVAAARASFLTGEQMMEDQDEDRGCIPPDLAHVCRRSADLVIRAAWHPKRTRITRRHALSRLLTEIQDLPSVLSQLALLRQDLASEGDPIARIRPHLTERGKR
jgi:hypothetical protein